MLGQLGHHSRRFVYQYLRKTHKRRRACHIELTCDPIRDSHNFRTAREKYRESRTRRARNERAQCD